MCIMCKELEDKINNIRQILVETGLNKGLNNPETIRQSELLDKLIYQFQTKC